MMSQLKQYITEQYLAFQYLYRMVARIDLVVFWKLKNFYILNRINFNTKVTLNISETNKIK